MKLKTIIFSIILLSILNIGYSSQKQKIQIIDLINIQRQAYGLSKVIENPYLELGAQKRAFILDYKNQWSHDGFVESIGIFVLGNKRKVGENLAKNFTGKYIEKDLVNAWMNSPKHREILLDKEYKYVGISKYKEYFVLWMSSTL